MRPQLNWGPNPLPKSVLVSKCRSLFRHFARRFLNQTWNKWKSMKNVGNKMYNIPVYCPSRGRAGPTPGCSHTNIHISPIRTIQTQTSKNIQRPRKNDDIMEFFITTNFTSCLHCALEIIFSLSKSVTAAVFWCWYQLSVVSDCSNNDINKVNNPTFALFWANIVVHENRQLYIYIYIKFTWCMKIHQLFSSIKFRIIKFKVSTFIGNYRAIKRCEIVSSNFIL